MLLTRSPLSPKTSFDLHVLGMPPAFVLSHNQTLKLSKLDKRLKFTERPYFPGGVLNALASTLILLYQRLALIVYCVDYQGI